MLASGSFVCLEPGGAVFCSALLDLVTALVIVLTLLGSDTSCLLCSHSRDSRKLRANATKMTGFWPFSMNIMVMAVKDAKTKIFR